MSYAGNSPSSFSTPSYFGNVPDSPAALLSATGKNRIINPDFQINQRGLTAYAANNAALYTFDRWLAESNAGLNVRNFSVQITPDAPQGCSTSVLLIGANNGAPAAANRIVFQQLIEGFNIADFRWGTPLASPVSLSFWVKSSVVGEFSVYVSGATPLISRSFVTTFTVGAAGVWEYKRITVPGDTSGTWNTDQSLGAVVGFDLGCGSNFNTTAPGAWAAGDRRRVSGATSWIASAGPSLQIAGVQLEIGPSATAFDRRPYGVELDLCRRYWRPAPPVRFAGYQAAGSQSQHQTPISPPMRVAPTVTQPTIDGVSSVNIASWSIGVTSAEHLVYNATPTALGFFFLRTLADGALSSEL